MYYCFDSRIDFEYTKAEMARAKKLGLLIIYDKENDSFFDSFGNVMDINGLSLFPRTGVEQIFELNDSITRHGGIPILSNDEVNVIYDWPKHISTKRKIEVLKGIDVIKNAGRLLNEYGNKIFIKTKNKNFSEVIDTSILLNPNSNFCKAISLHQDEDFIISEKIDILEDQHGIIEYRSFVMNGELCNISRLTTEVFHQIPEEDIKKMNKIIARINSSMPSFYVVDFFVYIEDGARKIDVCELNPISSSGLYLYNSIYDKHSDLTHPIVEQVSLEFLDSLDAMTYDGDMINGRSSLEDIPFSFANDLRNICYFGEANGSYISTHLDSRLYGKEEPVVGRFNFTIVEDDDDLMLL